MNFLPVYLKRGEYNLIMVNWGKLAALPWYVTAVRNTRTVGPQVARLVNWLDRLGAVSLANLHVIGFSLGAEIAGFMGKALAPRKVGRITGLDAAYPLYMNSGREGHLTASDAMFVDVIHTDGGNFGFPNPIGHVDFYPNGGKPLQPGCNLQSVIRNSFSRLINQYSTILLKSKLLKKYLQVYFIIFFLFYPTSRLWTQSSLDALRRIREKSLRISSQPVPKMAP
ncbi:Hepatic triacylglycerol lipase [Habropoda laboriosa]|uniref:phospholipase A1 n=1 Tax=Habropoda laboriosa TaxID=597456 RepID=A0A0L7RCR6_9HYME|nr:Hepatic triacylglycerol lipase [Habropoda laboriosa]